MEDLPLQYSFAYQPRTSAGEGGVGADAPPSEQQIRGKALAQTASFAPSAGNGSVVLAVHDLWGGRAMAYEPLDVVPVTPSLRLTPTPTPTPTLTLTLTPTPTLILTR